MFRNVARFNPPRRGPAKAAGAAALCEVTIVNLAGACVGVSCAHAYGPFISAGWWGIPPNDSQRFSATEDEDLFLRIETLDRKELRPAERHEERFFPVRPDERFHIEAAPNDHNGRILSWGGELEQSGAMTIQQALPDGWVMRRFFQAPGGRATLEIRPDGSLVVRPDASKPAAAVGVQRPAQLDAYQPETPRSAHSAYSASR